MLDVGRAAPEDTLRDAVFIAVVAPAPAAVDDAAAAVLAATNAEVAGTEYEAWPFLRGSVTACMGARRTRR